LAAPVQALLGVTELTVGGAEAVTRKAQLRVSVAPPGLVTITE
jgi:hypothetical protein